MVFANYELSNNGRRYIGDNIQIYAIDEFYRKCGIKNIAYIKFDELSTYNGEYAILPVTLPLINYVNGGIAGWFSSHIIPVFLGLTIAKSSLTCEEVQYLKNYEPIGCRDECTMLTMRKYGIQSYLGGCITLTLETALKTFWGGRDKVYIVDVKDDLLRRIPTEIKDDAVYRTHFTSFEKGDNAKEFAIQLFREYDRNAKLVITSLLHCALPCIAAGIPVIFLQEENLSYRFSWLEKLIPLYTKDCFEKIDWNPKPIDISFIKKKVFEVDKRRIFSTYEEKNGILDISWFYENRDKHFYVNDSALLLKQFIDDHWKREDEIQYSFWGMTQTSEWLVDYIEENYPNASLAHIYDSYRNVTFRGIVSEKPEVITQRNPNEIVFVTGYGAVNAANEFFHRIHKKEGTYAFCTVPQ